MGTQSGGTQNSSSSTMPFVPPFLMKYYHNIANDYASGQKNLPNITQLYQGTPLLGTAQLTPDEQALIGQFQQNIGPNTPENAAQYGYSQFAGGGPNKPSAATEAAMKEFNDLQAPLIQSQSALSGLGNSGANLAALAQGQEQAAVPFLQQDLQNQLTAAQGLGALGGQEASQMQQQLQDALTAAGMPREIAQQVMQNQFNQQQQKWNFAQGIQTGGASQFPSLIGGGNTQGSSSTSAPKF